MVTKAQARRFLQGYLVDTPRTRATIECILAQLDEDVLDARIDRSAGRHETGGGPEAMADATGFELSALYECHEGPHLPTCPERSDA